MKSKFKIALMIVLTLAVLVSVLVGCDKTDKCIEHKYGEWIRTTEATCTESGSKKHVCETCNNEETEVINALGHNYVNKVCLRCGHKYFSSGLEYTLNDDGASYSVSGIGISNDTEITVPRTYKGKPVTGIGNHAFGICRNIVGIEIPDSVTTVGDNAFFQCSGLKSVVIPDSVTTIGENAFSGCDSLTSVIIGNSVTSIGYGAFSSCSDLTNIVIPDSVTRIDKNAFMWCIRLTSVTMSKSVTFIGSGAFSECTALSSMNYDGTINEWKSINKEFGWHTDSAELTVHCTDGTVTVNGGNETVEYK